MLDLRDTKRHAKIAFLSGINCTAKVHQQKAIPVHGYSILHDDDEPLELIRCNRLMIPGRSIIFADDIKLINAALYIRHNRELYMLSIRVKILHLKLEPGCYRDFYERVFLQFAPPYLEKFSTTPFKTEIQ